jgi:hypothetical protein
MGMTSKESGMKKTLLPLLVLLGLGGCVAVPVSDGYYGGGYAPAPVYVAPSVVVHGTYYYRDGRRYRHR